MPDDDGTFELSRRKALAGLGTIGVASAGAGLGTSAFFSDTETFQDNSLTAGELDLKVDWEEHYSDWKGDETAFAEMPSDPATADYFLPAFDIPSDFASGGVSGEIGPLESGLDMAPMDGRPISLNFKNDEDDREPQDAFWDATSIEAYPDKNDDGIQDEFDDSTVCSSDILADLPGEEAPFSGDLDSDRRTQDSRGDPLINLNDLKPGDFGEVTFSFHLCDNPGFVWLTSELVDADENGNTEPEAKDEDERGPENVGDGEDEDNPEALFDNEGDETDDSGNIIDSSDPADTEQERVELLDYVLTRFWYDDGNNQVDQIEGQLDIVIATDISGSLNQDELDTLQDGVDDFIDDLEAAVSSGADIRVGTLQFGDEVTITNAPLDVPSNVSVTPTTADGSRRTAMPPALDIADQLVNDTGNGARSGAEKAVVVFTDGGPNYLSQEYTADTYTAPRGSPDDTGFSANDTNDQYDKGNGGSDVTVGEMEETVGVADAVKAGGTRIATVYVGENDTQAMTTGTGSAVDKYTDLPTYLASSGPIASSATDAYDVDLGDLGELTTALVDQILVSEEVFFIGTLREALTLAPPEEPGFLLNGDLPAEEGGGVSETNCFSPETTHYVGFEWWLPINHGNQIQGDSVQFDIGFYTEQCRHNDGSGQEAES